MKKSKSLWRALLFFVVIAALCGSFALPVERMLVSAAPLMAISPGNVVISEFRTRGSNTGKEANDEFIELYNVTGGAIDISGLEIWGSNGNNPPAISRRITILPNTILEPGQHYLVANSSGYNNTNIPADQTYGVGISDNGGIALIMPGIGIIDQVGMSNNSAYKEGTILPPFTTNADRSYERKLGGSQGSCVDANDNSSDFRTISPSDPQNSSSAFVYCAGLETFTPTDTPANTDTPTATNTATATSTALSTATPTRTGTPLSSLSVVINEVAWSGTAASTNDEWIELHNTTSLPIDITGWELYGDDNVSGKVGSPDIHLKGIIPANGYFLIEENEAATDVPSNQVDSSINLLNTGERLYLQDNSNPRKTIDTANLDGGAWPAGSGSPNYASMERVYTTGNQWVTYQGTVPVAYNRNGGPIKGTPGFANWINTASLTTITSDLPDPSLVNQLITVRVTVIGGTTTPTGTVAISGTNQNCTITLSSGTGSCSVKFTSVGTKTIIATYHSTNGLPSSNDTESHQVVTSGTVYKTPTPIPPPPPQLVVINEFVPRPGHDWNHDGVVNVGDEYIELLNHGTVDVNLSGWRLDDEVNVGSDPYSLPAKTIKPGERIVFYGSDTGLLLGDGGDAVRLLKPNGQLIDAYNYTVARYPDESFCRLPDNGGADDWNQFCFPTPGIQNSMSGNFAPPPSTNVNEQLSCPLSDMLPEDFVQAECDPFGKNIWRPAFWDRTGWYDEKNLPAVDGKWPVFAD